MPLLLYGQRVAMFSDSLKADAAQLIGAFNVNSESGDCHTLHSRMGFAPTFTECTAEYH